LSSNKFLYLSNQKVQRTSQVAQKRQKRGHGLDGAKWRILLLSSIPALRQAR
jgi:hypothetical protein